MKKSRTKNLGSISIALLLMISCTTTSNEQDLKSQSENTVVSNTIHKTLVTEGIVEILDKEGEIVLDADEDRIVCKRVVKTGTRIGAKRVCMTKKEAEEERKRTQEQLRNSTRGGDVLPDRG